MEAVESPDSKQHAYDLGIIERIILINSLVVTLIRLVVTVSNALSL